ncbi:MAG: hypothetical protein EZS28_038248 [Streblomastix strix]|uniref:Uncharacterized protein n=1 Tax=Streblomastix strix TaxID=222440 RepID=A0A5J4U949_9EUKA|nr:MAG: hypothetical protein EZS28_038248 [Streblomastix strix]
MAVPKEYNVIGGLPGVGPDIMLEFLSEFRLISNAVQFLCVCKKTHSLMKHNRFIRIVEQLNYPISIINKEPDCTEFVDIDGVQMKINKEQHYACTISLVQVLDNGIWSFEAVFQNTYINGAIGIVRNSYNIPATINFCQKPHTDHIAVLSSRGYEYPVYYKGKGTYGNDQIKDDQILRLEFDSFKVTLILFINNPPEEI